MHINICVNTLTVGHHVSNVILSSSITDFLNEDMVTARYDVIVADLATREKAGKFNYLKLLSACREYVRQGGFLLLNVVDPTMLYTHLSCYNFDKKGKVQHKSQPRINFVQIEKWSHNCSY